MLVWTNYFRNSIACKADPWVLVALNKFDVVSPKCLKKKKSKNKNLNRVAQGWLGP